jgi:hypothetical protein
MILRRRRRAISERLTVLPFKQAKIGDRAPTDLADRAQ